MARISDLDGLRVLQAKLAALPDGLYVDRHGNPCRHPSSLYSTSRSKVLRRMQAITNAVRVERRPDENIGRWPAAMEALEALLAAIDSHADDLKTIIGISVPSLAKRTAKNASALIDEIFEELVGRPFNRIRHHNESLEMRSCFDAEIAVYGYFVSAVREDGAIAPSKRAHGTTGNAWSFAVTIRRLLAQMIRAAQNVERHLPGSQRPELTAWSEDEGAALRDIAEWVQRSPALCFPNEVSLQIPDVGLRDGSPYVQLDTLKRLRNAATRPGLSWTTTFTADGKTRSFAID